MKTNNRLHTTFRESKNGAVLLIGKSCQVGFKRCPELYAAYEASKKGFKP